MRLLTLVVLAAALGTAAVIIYTAVVRTWEITQQDRKTGDDLRGIVPEPVPVDPGVLTSEDENRAAAIVEQFLNAKSVDERLQFVREPERLEPLMREWYSKNDAVTEWPDGEVVLRKKIIDQERYFIILVIDFVDMGKRIFAVEQKQDVYKLDWETAIGYQPTPLAEFKRARPTTPVRFRAKLKQSDYYNFNFSDRERYQAAELSYPGRNEFKLFGYIDRKAKWAPALIKRLDDGEGPSLIVELQYPSGDLEDDSQVEIVSIVSESWWISSEPGAAP